jgi:ribosomal protein S18 acetylase RimI-like enzyme
MQIVQSTKEDIETIFSFYDMAVVYQKTKFEKHWLPFDKEMVKKEVLENKQWKILEADEVACVFAIAYEDPFIWKEKNIDPSIYIHRIVTHPAFRGKHYVKAIIEWARRHAIEKEKKFIRMDTWGDNQGLIDYYVKCGFKFLGPTKPEPTDELPKHYSAILLGLFEISLEAGC